MFRHSPLARDPPHIRLIRFRQPETKDGADTGSHPNLSLDVKHEPLDRSSGAYIALSYVWGDAKVNAADIEVDGLRFSIGRNLHDLLAVLSRNEQLCQSWIWVDSICIHQGDDDEKTLQVALMGDIFRQASMVCSWLGASSPQMDAALDYISELGIRAFDAGVLESTALGVVLNSKTFWDDHSNQALAANGIDDGADAASRFCSFLCDFISNAKLDDLQKQNQIAKGLASLLVNDYWHRVWIIQEIALNDNTLLFCGNKVVPMFAFEAFLYSRELIEVASDTFFAHVDPMSGIFKNIPTNSGHIPALDVRRNQRYGLPPSLASLIVRFELGPYRPHYSATDPRDIAFGLLGIIRDKEELGLQVNYAQTTAQTLATLTRALFERDKQHYFILDGVVPRSTNDPNHLCLPSWVPDWPKMGSGKAGNEGWPVNYEDHFDATAERRHGPRHTSTIQETTQDRDPLVLAQPGCYVDTVTEVMVAPQYRCANEWSPLRIVDAPAWLSRVAEFARLGPEICPGDDYVWRTLLRTLPLPVPNNTKSTGDNSRAWIHRHVMRKVCPRFQDLPESVADDLQKGLYHHPFFSDPDKHLDFLMSHLPSTAGMYSQGRTLFKTEKGMFGAGRDVIQPGDIVTLIWGVGSPILLQPLGSETGGERFWFKGDAYIDGIMQGEFLETRPSERVFHIV